MPKVWTEEERKAFGEKMKAAKAAASATTKADPVEGTEAPIVYLDLTAKQLETEPQLEQYILWEFDSGRLPTHIKITSHQARAIASATRQKPLRFYQSPFGNHYFKIVPAKEIQDGQEEV